MHFKSFLAGALFGALAFAVITWLIPANNSPEFFADDARIENEISTPSNLPAKRQDPTPTATATAPVPVPDEPDEDEFEDVREALEHGDRDRPHSIDLPDGANTVPVPLTDIHKKLLTNDGAPDGRSKKLTETHTALEAEPKDDSWAYYMEQSLQQYLAADLEIQQFEISNIECRSTMCELQVIGFDESTGPVWNRILFNMRHQPWYEFGETGSSSSTIDGRLAIITTIHRLQPEN